MSLYLLASLLIGAQPARYDHFSEKHAPVACNSCHQRSPSNKWEHARFPKKDHRPCENSGCHAGELVKFDPRKPAYCRSCHTSGPGGHGINIRKVVYPPYRRGEATQFGMAISNHQKHIEGGKCQSCHAENKTGSGPDMSFAGHSACATCHGEKEKPSMSECTSCHLKRDASTSLASTSTDEYRVAKHFTHADHASKSKKNECGACHLNANVGKGVRAPLPSMADCTSCHDGEQAFDALGSRCMRCHESNQANPAPEFKAELQFFSHLNHSDRNVVGEKGAYACADCHPSTERGRLFFPAGGKDFDPKHDRNGHWPCEKCHQTQFLTRDTKGICLVCHAHQDPGRANPVKAEFRARREMVTNLPHEKHQKTECDRCHFEQSGAPKPALAGGLLAPAHDLCAQCHETHKEAPMKKCDACHRSLAPAELAATKWSVAQKFTHETHQVDIRTAEVVDTATIGWARTDKSSAKKLDCTACHLKLDSGEHPQMKSCHACHDGKIAFKDTGFECVRCHGPGSEKGS